MSRKWIVLSLISIFSTAVVGCGSGAGEDAKSVNSKASAPADGLDATKPVTLKIVDTGLVTDEEFQMYLAEPVKKKYPNITLELIRQKYSVDRYELLLAKGEKFDLLFEANLLFDDVIAAKLADNMEPMLKKHNIDLNRIEQVAVDSFKIASGGQYLSAVPFTRHFNALYYNKDLFDKFGAAYPKDGMTWDETIELTRKVTRTADGVVYRGLDPDLPFRTASVIGQPIIDAKTHQSTLQNEKWKQMFQMYKTIYDIPGYKEKYVNPNNFGEFTKGNLAMLAGLNILPSISKVANTLNWDMVSYPSLKEAPNTGHEFDGHGILVSAISEKKDAAYKVVEVLLSDDNQLNMARNGKMPILKNTKVQEEFGKNVDYLQGKNVKAIYKTMPAKSHVPTPYDSKARTIMNKYNKDILTGVKDLNSALREMDEEITKMIAENKK
ncbi:extracellular solute-binding protein [Paenibacillus hemerocallicola]|uniref:Extracellular solute-binding protein n=1 Tax=Paenibacillus hemerocallicola TaxID=1172614 RepID=A0A5C4SWU2_9BACL|nr:extracellular solute-binding protein [Paenibacillus hemerocallicola]TNJ58673.1 extracellular solute-binding protein [Paenibacillus hemerocallicola]